MNTEVGGRNLIVGKLYMTRINLECFYTIKSELGRLPCFVKFNKPLLFKDGKKWTVNVT